MKKLNRVLTTAAMLALALLMLPAPGAAQKSYRDATGGFLNETTFLASAAYTTTQNAITPVDLGSYASGVIVVNVTVVSGSSPTLTVNFQTCSSAPGAQTAPANANCVTEFSTSSITATGVSFIKVDHFARWNTINAVIGGTTPSFTMTVIGYFKPTS